MIWWAVAVHVAWGQALLVDPAVTPIVILAGLHWIISLGVEGYTLGVALLVAAFLAVVSLLAGRRLSNSISFILLMPQYGLLVAAFVSDAQSVASGRVNEREIDRLLLFTALWPMMAAALLHSAAIVERHVLWNRR
jgi:hypothetical protein